MATDLIYGLIMKADSCLVWVTEEKVFGAEGINPEGSVWGTEKGGGNITTSVWDMMSLKCL